MINLHSYLPPPTHKNVHITPITQNNLHPPLPTHKKCPPTPTHPSKMSSNSHPPKIYFHLPPPTHEKCQLKQNIPRITRNHAKYTFIHLYQFGLRYLLRYVFFCNTIKVNQSFLYSFNYIIAY